MAGGGFLGASVGLAMTSMITVETGYVTGILPGMVVFGVFAGATTPAATNAALHGVTGQDSGLASGVQSTMQQVGSALGLAVLVTVALRHATGSTLPPAEAGTSGYALALRLGAALMALGGVLILVLFERVDIRLRDPMAEQVRQVAGTRGG